ncbi:GALNT10 [Branchiostoma lanceolatum]|uniref:Polypeptide N-acetylgalactosaminyltransferase n=1 Tax=Branchiostoma lanceolatum TaxID=7740 RepID=A0A8K0ES72_BRALA|nr:GALNT10 [Branchiostoma lanceolatum]
MFQWLMKSMHYDQLRKYVGEEETLVGVLAKTDVWLYQMDPLLDLPRPSMPNMVNVGGILAREASPLPKDLELFMQSSGSAGVVVVSFGSQATTITPERAEVMAAAFAQLRQKVVWRYVGEKPAGLGNNTKLMAWLPQNDLLGHPKTLAFVTHAGSNGLYEALYHGVPMVCTPLGGDQPGNAARAVSRGLGVRVDFNTFTIETLYQAMMQVVTDKSYQETAARLSRLHRDQPQPPMERAVWWVEHVIKHGGLPHLRARAVELPWYQYYLLDVAVFLLGVCSAVLGTLEGQVSNGRCLQLADESSARRAGVIKADLERKSHPSVRCKHPNQNQHVSLEIVPLGKTDSQSVWVSDSQPAIHFKQIHAKATVSTLLTQIIHQEEKKLFPKHQKGLELAEDLDRIDWHDHARIKSDQQRTGPGEQGKPADLTAEERGPHAYEECGFNIKASNKISLDRAIPDIRHPNCGHKKYVRDLPDVSLVIPFHNEGWTTLLRTVHSVLNRSPEQLIHEIILVDDFSDRAHLGKELEDYVAKFPKVRVVRTKQREGLIRTRLLGAQVAKGDVLIFLDSHCEANVNWLPPLLEPIALNKKTIVCPNIDVIDKDDFHYETQAGDAMRGAFDWEMYYKRIPIPDEIKNPDPSDPFESPVMAGGLFAVDREYFEELGGYDPGLDIWGGEQYELSFKVWQCGGRMVDAPCSRVGHVYRKFVPYKVPAGVNLGKNLKRVAEVWMDEYKEHLYRRRPHLRQTNMGDISGQLQLRERLKCKPFKWFMKVVAPDIILHYPPVEPEPAASGEIRNKASNLCIDSKHGGGQAEVRLDQCVKGGKIMNGEQVCMFDFQMSWHNDIRPRGRTFCFDAQMKGGTLILFACHQMLGNQHWLYYEDKQQLLHKVTGGCLEGNSDSKSLFLSECDHKNAMQQWSWEKTNSTYLRMMNTGKCINTPEC